MCIITCHIQMLSFIEYLHVFWKSTLLAFPLRKYIHKRLLSRFLWYLENSFFSRKVIFRFVIFNIFFAYLRSHIIWYLVCFFSEIPTDFCFIGLVLHRRYMLMPCLVFTQSKILEEVLNHIRFCYPMKWQSF